MDRVFVEAHIADIHFGACNPEAQYELLKEQFYDTLMRLPKLDIISVDGDLFHHKFMANSDAVLCAVLFIKDLANICRAKNSTLLLIAGTALHDADQLKLFTPYTQDILSGVDVRIVEDVQFEYIKGKKILIIPELYGKGEDYYNQYLKHSGFYDACYMHGTFQGAIFGKETRNLDSDREPIFSMDDFINCTGPIISGHVHKANCFKEHFYYCGSPYRWQFGEEEDKGYIILLHDLDSRMYRVHFEPIMGFRYDTYDLDYLIDQEPKQIIDFISQRQKEGVDHIRIRFTKNNETNLAIIRNYYRNNSNVKIEADFQKKQMLDAIQTVKEDNKQYQYIFDNTITPYQKLVNYINQEEGSVFITVDELKSILSEEIV